jgi:hypothetical protein
MNKETTFSSVPVGQIIEYKGISYTRFTYERGKHYIDGKIAFKHIPKHEIVTWINAYPSNLEA